MVFCLNTMNKQNVVYGLQALAICSDFFRGFEFEYDGMPIPNDFPHLQFLTWMLVLPRDELIEESDYETYIGFNIYLIQRAVYAAGEKLERLYVKVYSSMSTLISELLTRLISKPHHRICKTIRLDSKSTQRGDPINETQPVRFHHRLQC